MARPARRPDAPKRDPWKDSEGPPGEHRVFVEELPERGWGLYLRWQNPETRNWSRKSLGVKLTDETGRWLTGRALATAQAAAKGKAFVKHQELTGEIAAPAPEAPPEEQADHATPLTLGETQKVITDRDTGGWSTVTPHQKEVLRSLKFAVAIWGEDTEWGAIDRAKLTQLGRRKMAELVAAAERRRAAGRMVRPNAGYRGAEVVVKNILAIASWLREEFPKRVPAHAALPPMKWKEKLAEYWTKEYGEGRAPKPQRHRFTLEQVRALINNAWRIDPRLELILSIGAEMRVGQVRRAQRSDLDLAARTFEIVGQGNKKGQLEWLTDTQLAVLARLMGEGGYLYHLEQAFEAKEIRDYPLFPQGQMPGGRSGRPMATVARHARARPVGKRTLLSWFHELRELPDVNIPAIPWTAFYGIRRQAVDAARKEGISDEALQALGGWVDDQMAKKVYAADEQLKHARAAAEVRARTRGEVPSPVTASPEGSPTDG